MDEAATATEVLELKPERVKRAKKAPENRPMPEILRGRPWALIRGNGLGKAGMATLADDLFDHGIIDPPYSPHVHKNQRPSVAGDSLAEKRALSFKAITQGQRVAMAREWVRLVKGWVVVHSDVEGSHFWRLACVKAGLEYIRTLPWIRRGGTPQKTGDRPPVCHEDVLFFHRPGKKVWYGSFGPEPYDVPIVSGHGVSERRVHEAQKPLALMEKIVADVSARGDFILDNCAGSGTTLVAAVRLGRYALGYERDKKASGSALTRLGIVREQLDLLE